MLDTNTVSYIVKGISPAARNRLSSIGSGDIACISSITEAELWCGLARIGASERRRTTLSASSRARRCFPGAGKKPPSTARFVQSRNPSANHSDR